MSNFILKKFPEVLEDIKLNEVSKNIEKLLSKYDGMVEFAPFPEILTTILFYQESVMSSRLEGTVATITDLLDYKVGKEVSKTIELDAMEIENYKDALGYCMNEVKEKNYEISNIIIKNMQYIILDKSRGTNKLKGVFKQRQNYIGNKYDGEITYTPPVSYLQTQDYMDNFVEFINSDNNLHPLIKIAVIHAYFELVHHFEDGNGRVGRILIPILMKKYNILSTHYFYISYYFAKYRNDYISALENISKNSDWDSWINFFLKAVEVQTETLMRMLRRLKEIRKSTEVSVLKLNSQFSIQILNFMFRRIRFKSTTFIEETKINPNTARSILKQLEYLNIISMEEKGVGRAPSIYSFIELNQMVEEIKA